MFELEWKTYGVSPINSWAWVVFHTSTFCSSLQVCFFFRSYIFVDSFEGKVAISQPSDSSLFIFFFFFFFFFFRIIDLLLVCVSLLLFFFLIVGCLALGVSAVFPFFSLNQKSSVSCLWLENWANRAAKKLQKYERSGKTEFENFFCKLSWSVSRKVLWSVVPRDAHRNWAVFFVCTIPRSCFFFLFFFFWGRVPLLFLTFLTFLFFPLCTFFRLSDVNYFSSFFVCFFLKLTLLFFVCAGNSWIDYSSDRIAKSTCFSFQEEYVESITTPIWLRSEVDF